MRVRVAVAVVALLASVVGPITVATPAQAASLVVTTLDDTSGGPECSLRDAITAANTDAAFGGCAAGVGADTITFSVSGTITLDSRLPNLESEVTLDGAGGIAISGASAPVLHVVSTGEATVRGLTIEGVNRPSSSLAGGIVNEQGSLTVIDSTITGKSALYAGAIFSFEGPLSVIDSTIADNSGLVGAILSAYGGLSVVGSTITGNSGDSGVFAISGVASIVNTTVTGNTSLSGSRSTINVFEGSVSLTSVTVAGNEGDGVTVESGTEVSLVNSIVAGNTGSDVSGTLTAEVASVVGIPDGLTFGDIFDGGLSDNGGPTQTMALAQTPGNPALGGGDVDACAAAPVSGVDQRGVLRLADRCDIGAYESPRSLAEVSPAVVGFGDGTVGATTGARAVTVANTGNVDLAFESDAVSVTGADRGDFSLASDACSDGSIPPGGTCQVDVAFTPSAVGARSAALVVAPGALPDALEVALTGSGVAVSTGAPPGAPLSGTYSTIKGPRTVVQWAGSLTQAAAGGSVEGYWVSVNGNRACTTGAAASQCTLDAAYGSRARVVVHAFNEAGDSEGTPATYSKSPRAVVFGSVRFRADSAKLTRSSKRTVRAYTRLLVDQGFAEVVLKGYTAKTASGSKAFRVALSKKRAKAVKGVMRAELRSLDASMRITIRAKGGASPKASNSTRKGRAQNRRATVNIW